jgi:hypothetical protein
MFRSFSAVLLVPLFCILTALELRAAPPIQYSNQEQMRIAKQVKGGLTTNSAGTFLTFYSYVDLKELVAAGLTFEPAQIVIIKLLDALSVSGDFYNIVELLKGEHWSLKISAPVPLTPKAQAEVAKLNKARLNISILSILAARPWISSEAREILRKISYRLPVSTILDPSGEIATLASKLYKTAPTSLEFLKATQFATLDSKDHYSPAIYERSTAIPEAAIMVANLENRLHNEQNLTDLDFIQKLSRELLPFGSLSCAESFKSN